MEYDELKSGLFSEEVTGLMKHINEGSNTDSTHDKETLRGALEALYENSINPEQQFMKYKVVENLSPVTATITPTALKELPIEIVNLPHITKVYKPVPPEHMYHLMSDDLPIKFKRIHPKAQIPKKQHRDDAGYDLTAVSVSYGVNRQVIYGTGLCIDIPPGYVGKIYPRSSIRKLSLTLSNSVGIIDAGYTGEIQVTFRQHDLSEIYNSGDRIAQLVIEKLIPVDFIEVDELDRTERGEGGHGSTGK